MDAKRWEYIVDDDVRVNWEQSEHGDWVEYRDYAAALAAKDAEIKRLTERAERAESERDDLKSCGETDNVDACGECIACHESMFADVVQQKADIEADRDRLAGVVEKADAFIDRIDAVGDRGVCSCVDPTIDNQDPRKCEWCELREAARAKGGG